jgi:SAM-dependent methyltransferase
VVRPLGEDAGVDQPGSAHGTDTVRPGGSVSFDRAAEYYDRTRSLDPQTAAAQTELLLGQLATAPGPALEIGVGTGRVALPLAEAGARVVGVDLSAAMLDRLLAKDPARRLPVVLGDALRLPFAHQVFGAVVACHVLHLVADWVGAVEEVRRVLRPGGVLLVTRGSAPEGLLAELSHRVRAAVGVGAERRIGLDQLDALDQYVADAGGSVELLPPIERQGPAAASGEGSVGAYLDNLAAGMYSWTWHLPADRVAAAVAEVREWVSSEYGDPSAFAMPFVPIRWHRYSFAAPPT